MAAHSMMHSVKLRYAMLLESCRMNFSVKIELAVLTHGLDEACGSNSWYENITFLKIFCFCDMFPKTCSDVNQTTLAI